MANSDSTYVRIPIRPEDRIKLNILRTETEKFFKLKHSWVVNKIFREGIEREYRSLVRQHGAKKLSDIKSHFQSTGGK